MTTPGEKRHTRGPWENGNVTSLQYEGTFVDVQIAPGRRKKDDKNGGMIIARCYGTDMKENARIIAAAPDLYEALKKIAGDIELPIEIFSSCKTHKDRMITAGEARRRFDRETAREALSRAEGGRE